MAITFGDASAPSQITINLDALFSTSLANYEKTMVDQVGASNSLFHKVIGSSSYKSETGGTDLRIPLMYQLGEMRSYDGYDELSTLPMDGITEAVYLWRQEAVPIAYSMKEVIQNRHKLIDLVKAKITQAEMGFQEGFATHLLQGSGAGALRTPKTDSINGSSSIEPLLSLVDFTPTTSTSIGNINQSTYSWWQNKTKTSSATTYEAFLMELLNLYNTCALGTGGPPDLIIFDQVTYELFTFAFFQKYRQIQSDMNFPFENTKFKSAVVVFDDKVPDVANNTVTITEGSGWFLNTKFFNIKYMNDRNFSMLPDENGKTFVKPINGDSRVGHIAWMGNTCISNRRKQGVIGDIATSLT